MSQHSSLSFRDTQSSTWSPHSGRFEDQPEGNQCALFFYHSTKMGKKNRHSNKNRTHERLFVQNARQPTAAVRARLFHLFNTEKKYGELLKIEQKFRHCDTFSDDPVEDVSIRNVFGNVHMMEVEGACSDRAIQYFERARAIFAAVALGR